jgi:aminocarboxymuconate-semialdehyde decarboxylase
MIIDTHAHALDEGFLEGICRTPRFGLSADRDTARRFCVRRGNGASVTLDDDLINIPRRIDSLRRRNIGLQLIAPPPRICVLAGRRCQRRICAHAQ